MPARAKSVFRILQEWCASNPAAHLEVLTAA